MSGLPARAAILAARALPRPIINWVGRAQFAGPRRQALLGRMVAALREGEHRVATGPAKGLLFNAGGSHPGFVLGTSEPDVQDFLIRTLTVGDTFYDIGANVGFLSVVGSRLVGPSGRVVAFEPLPENAAVIRSNVERNDLSNVDVCEAAVSCADGTVSFGRAAYNTGGSLTTDGTKHDVIEVAGVSIDGLVASGRCPSPNLIKLDAEGSELDVLRGAADVLRQTGPILLIETHGTKDEVTSFLEEQHYRVRQLEPEGTSHWNVHLVCHSPE